MPTPCEQVIVVVQFVAVVPRLCFASAVENWSIYFAKTYIGSRVPPLDWQECRPVIPLNCSSDMCSSLMMANPTRRWTAGKPTCAWLRVDFAPLSEDA